MFGQGFNYGFLGKPLCFTDTTDIFKDNSGVALYTLDYDASDSGNATGKFGEAAVFNGSSSNVSVTGSLINSLTSISYSAWVYYRGTGSGQSYAHIVSGGATNSTASGKGLGMAVQNSNDILYIWAPSGASFSTTTLPENVWTHLALTNSGGTAKLYMNGSLIHTASVGSLAFSSSSNNLRIGEYYYNGSHHFYGEIDQVRIFNKVLSASEVTTLYNETKNTTNTLQILGDTSCIATYPLDGSSTDLSGNYSGTDTNILYKYDATPTNVDFGVGGKSLYGARFNGSNSAIIVPNNILASNNHSISTWFYLNDTSGIQTLIEFDYGNRIIFRVASTDSNWAYIGSSGYFNHGISFSAGQWYHLAITFSAGNPFKIYVNGNLSYTGGNTNLYLRTADNIIGAANSSGAIGVDGTIDQVRLFNKALSGAEISKLYGNGTGEIACEYTATTTDINYPVANLAYYKLDNNSKALGETTGKFNQGATFVGNSTGIENSTLQLSSTAHSVSLWMKPQDLTATKWQIAFGSYFSGGPTFTLGKRPDQTTSFHYRNESSNEVYFTLSTANIWYHIVVTRNNSGSTVYVNGSSVATDSNSMGSYSYGGYQKAVIGSMPNYPAEYFSGTIDQVRVYNVVLTATDVANLYNNETVSTANTLSFPTGKTAIATYKLDGDGVDISGNYSGVGDGNVRYDYSGTDTDIEYSFGRFGQAAVFNGSSRIVTGITSFTNNFTISMWLNPSSLHSNGNWVFGNWNSTTQDFYIYVKSNGQLDLNFDGNDGSGTSFGSAGDISIGNWNHFAVSMSNGVFTIYLNSVLLGGGTTTNTTFSNGQDFEIGNMPKSSTVPGWNGSIDQVRIYSTPLTSSQVTELYNEKPEVDVSNFKTVLWKGNGATRYISSVGFEPSLTWFKARTVANYDHGLFDVLRGDGENYISSNLTSQERIPSSISNYGYVSSYDVNGVFLGQGGNSNHPWAVTNKSNVDYVAWNWKGGGLLNRSASFNGSSSKIVLPNSSLGITDASNFSFSCWFNTNSSTQDNQGIFWTNGSNAGARFGVGINSTSQGGDTSVYFGVGTSSFTYINSGTSAFAANTWVHVVGVKSSTTGMSLYVDNVLKATNTGATGAASSTATGDNRIGGYKTTAESSWFNGSIDQVRVFNKAISASEVTALYNETASTINTLQILGDTSCVAAYPLGVGAEDLSNTYSGTPSNVTFNNPGHLARNNSGTIESTVSANTEAGFSIVKYTGNGTTGATFGHGLSQRPDIIFFKGLDNARTWMVKEFTTMTSDNNYLALSGSDEVKTSGSSTFIKSTSDSNVIVLGDSERVNFAEDYIAYCWHSVAKYSSIGTYTGNGSTTGTIVTLDFAPSFVMIKGTDQISDWIMIDNKRDTTNPNSARIDANSPGAEYTGENIMDLNSNGFQLKTSSASKNGLNKVFIYMAFK